MFDSILFWTTGDLVWAWDTAAKIFDPFLWREASLTRFLELLSMAPDDSLG